MKLEPFESRDSSARHPLLVSGGETRQALAFTLLSSRVAH
jgi:hypothetical protein